MEQQYNEQYDEISLKELLTALWTEKKWIIAITIAVIALAGIYTFFIADTVYEASSELIIQSPKKGEVLSSATRYGAFEFPSNNPKDYINFIKSSEVVKKVVENQKIDTTIAGFQKGITIEQDKDANRFVVMTKANTAERAAEINMALVNTFIDKQRINYKKLAIDRFIMNYERSIDNLTINIESKERLLKERKALLDEIKPIYTLQKSLFNDPETAAAYADKFDLDLNELSQSMLVQENARGIYFTMESKYFETKDELINLRESLFNSKARLDELKSEKETLMQKKNTDDEQSILNGRIDVFADKILIASPAVTPQKPIAPRKALNLAIGAVLGLMLGVFVAFFVNYWKNS